MYNHEFESISEELVKMFRSKACSHGEIQDAFNRNVLNDQNPGHLIPYLMSHSLFRTELGERAWIIHCIQKDCREDKYKPKTFSVEDVIILVKESENDENEILLDKTAKIQVIWILDVLNRDYSYTYYCK